MNNNNVKKITLIAMFTLLFGCCTSMAAAPISIDVANNNVNVPGTIISEQIHSDYSQLATEQDIVQLVSNSASLWRTNLLGNNTVMSYVILDDGTIVFLDVDEDIYISRDGFRTSASTARDTSWISTFGVPALQRDIAGNIYMCVTTGSEKRAVVRMSSDCGSTWTDKLSATNVGAGYPSFAASERGDLVVMAGRKDEITTNLYIISSQDKGETWSYAYPSWQAKPYFIEDANPEMTYAGNGVFVGAARYYDNSGLEIFRSVDYGATWSSILTNSNSSGDSYPHFIRGNFAGTVVMQRRHDGRMLSISHDYGETWKDIRGFSAEISPPLNLYGKHWLYTLNGTLKYSPDDFATEKDLVVFTATGANPAKNGPVVGKNTILVGEKFSAGAASAIYSLDRNSFTTTKNTPFAVPVLSTAPAAYLGGLYTDGVTYFRCTNGTTWAEF